MACFHFFLCQGKQNSGNIFFRNSHLIFRDKLFVKTFSFFTTNWDHSRLTMIWPTKGYKARQDCYIVCTQWHTTSCKHTHTILGRLGSIIVAYRQQGCTLNVLTFVQFSCHWIFWWWILVKTVFVCSIKGAWLVSQKVKEWFSFGWMCHWESF